MSSSVVPKSWSGTSTRQSSWRSSLTDVPSNRGRDQRGEGSPAVLTTPTRESPTPAQRFGRGIPLPHSRSLTFFEAVAGDEEIGYGDLGWGAIWATPPHLRRPRRTWEGSYSFSDMSMGGDNNNTRKDRSGSIPAPERRADAPPRPVSYFKLYSCADALDWALMLVGGFGAVVHGAALPIFFLYFGRLINALGTANIDGLMNHVNKYSLYFVLIGMVVMIASYFEVACWMLTGERQGLRMRALYLRAMLSQEIAYFESSVASAHEKIEMLAMDPVLVQEAIGEKMANFLHFMSAFFAGFVVAFVSMWQIALVTLGIVPFLAITGGLYAVTLTGMSTKCREAYDSAGVVAEQILSQVRTVYAFVGEVKAVEDYTTALEKTLALGLQTGLAKGWGLGLTFGVMNLSWALIFYIAALLIFSGLGNGGVALSAILSIIVGSISLEQALTNLQAFGDGKRAGSRIFATLRRKPVIDGRRSVAGRTLEDMRGDIELRGIDFAYPSRPDVFVVRNLSLSISAGKTVALVGSMGSGKSTIVSLMVRWYDPNRGGVFIDGVNIKDFQLRWLRAHIGLVTKEPALIEATIEENIAYGMEGATHEQVADAARSANLDNYISTLPKAYATLVGERGVQLSTSLRQRLAIARVFLKNPKILLIDDATSALDTESEALVQDALDRLTVGRTTMVVAHRLSSIQNAEAIVVLELGRIVEIGTHTELLEKGPQGVYNFLVRTQARVQTQEAANKALEAEEESRERHKAAVRESEIGPASPPASPHHHITPSSIASSSTTFPTSGTQTSTTGAETPKTDLSSNFEAPLSPYKQITIINNNNNHSNMNASSAQRSGEKPVEHDTTVLGYVPDAATTVVSVAKKGKKDCGDDERVGGGTGEKLRRGGGGVWGIGKGRGSGGGGGRDTGVSRDFSQLLWINAPEWPYAVLGSIAAGAGGILNPVFGLFLAQMVIMFYERTGHNMRQKASMWSLAFVAMGVYSCLVHLIMHWNFSAMSERLINRLRVRMFASVLRNEVAWFDDEENNAEAVSERLATDPTMVRGVVSDRLAFVFHNTCLLAFAVVFAIYFHATLSLVVIATFPLLITAVIAQQAFIKGFGSDLRKLHASADEVAAQAVHDVRSVAAFSADLKVVNLYKKRLRGPCKHVILRAQVSGLCFGVSQLMLYASMGVCQWFAGHLMSKEGAEFGDVFRVFCILVITAFALGESLAGFPELVRSSAPVHGILALIFRRPLIEPDGPSCLKLDRVRGQIELRNVDFCYPMRPGYFVFRNINLLIPPYRTLAVVGTAGAGKSTIIALIERFYDPTAGMVLVDGHDIRNLHLRWLRSQISLVQHEPVLFATSIRDNIMYGQESATEAEIVGAARVANAHSFISSLPNGYNTEIGECGVQLSTGQKQRIAIARAVLKSPPILLIDGATGGLDPEAERVVQEALDRLMVGRTTVVIAHRLSTVRNAHIIAVVQNGRIVEQGSHNQLVSRPNGAYASLVKIKERPYGRTTRKSWMKTYP